MERPWFGRRSLIRRYRCLTQLSLYLGMGQGVVKRRKAPLPVRDHFDLAFASDHGAGHT